METNTKSNDRLLQLFMKVPREDLLDLFRRHNVIADQDEYEKADLVAEIRADGSNSFATAGRKILNDTIRTINRKKRFGELVDGLRTSAMSLGQKQRKDPKSAVGVNGTVNYDEIVRDVAKKVKARVPENMDSELDLELPIVQTVFKSYFDKLSDAEREDMRKVLNEVGIDFATFQNEFLKGSAAVLLAFLSKVSGRTLYRALFGIISKFAARNVARIAAYRTVGLFWTVVPFVNVALWGWMAIDIAGPAWRKTVPTVVQVSLLRLQFGE